MIFNNLVISFLVANPKQKREEERATFFKWKRKREWPKFLWCVNPRKHSRSVLHLNRSLWPFESPKKALWFKSYGPNKLEVFDNSANKFYPNFFLLLVIWAHTLAFLLFSLFTFCNGLNKLIYEWFISLCDVYIILIMSSNIIPNNIDTILFL